MARMTKQKRQLLFKGKMVDGSPGFTAFTRADNGELKVGNSAFGYSRMILSAKQAEAVREWLKETA